MYFSAVYLAKMSELDLIKEKIGYYKVWLGIMVITDISLVGWLVGNYASASLMIVGGCILSIYLNYRRHRVFFIGVLDGILRN